MTKLTVDILNYAKAPEKLEVGKSLMTVEPSFFVLENKRIMLTAH
jgi:hypothetical protein